MQPRLSIPLIVILLVFALLIPASAQLGCWGSLCQSAGGTLYLGGSIQATQVIAFSTVPNALTLPGDFVFACTRATSVSPGFNGLTVRARPGTQAGTMKLVAVAGSGGVLTEMTLFDNIPGGGC